MPSECLRQKVNTQRRQHLIYELDKMRKYLLSLESLYWKTKMITGFTIHYQISIKNLSREGVEDMIKISEDI